MKQGVVAIVVCVLFLALPGCKMTPEKVCKKFEDLYKETKKDAKEDALKKKRERCVESMKKMQEKQPDYYKCAADCVKGASKFDDAKGCYKSCAGKMKK
ncbi:MAG: hypothetical protein KC609_01450 [Myxococcales bacterium]|nr:hypothetical protein [Myxococcales bacterium]